MQYVSLPAQSPPNRLGPVFRNNAARPHPLRHLARVTTLLLLYMMSMSFLTGLEAKLGIHVFGRKTSERMGSVPIQSGHSPSRSIHPRSPETLIVSAIHTRDISSMNDAIPVCNNTSKTCLQAVFHEHERIDLEESKHRHTFKMRNLRWFGKGAR